MKKTIYIAIIILYSLSSFSQENENRLLTYGTENYLHSKATEFVADKWNIKIYKVAGTSVEKKVLDSIQVKNEELWEKLSQIKNTDSKKLFYKEVIFEMKDVLNAEKMLHSDRKTKRKIRKIDYSKDYSFTELESKKGNGIYLWTINSHEIENDYSGETNIEFNVITDLNIGKIEIIKQE